MANDQAVLEYLKSKGMSSAVLELQEKLKQASNSSTSSKSMREHLEHEDDVARNQRTALTKSAGGGFGYDRDAAAPIVQWGVPDNTSPADDKTMIGEKEANAYLDAFTSLQLWVLSLPDDHTGSNLQPRTHNAIAKAKELISGSKTISLSSLVSEMVKPTAPTEGAPRDAYFQVPPSAKPELFAVTFALLVHTYCELLEVGMEETAHVLRDAFHSIYQPFYEEEIKDLFHCTTTDDMVKLNFHNSQHMEALANLKQIVAQVLQCQVRQEEAQQVLMHSTDPATQQAKKQELKKYSQNIPLLKRKHQELSQRASAAFDRMHELPFLRRARAVRWQLTLSTASYGLLASFLNSTSMHSSLLAMSTLLQTKCELHIEQRDPLPFTPACILDDMDEDNNKTKPWTLNESTFVNWAAPVPRNTKDEQRPFPKLHLDEEYEDEKSAERDKKAIEFNRNILINGFRRLEALERKREFEAYSSSGNKEENNNNNPVLADPLEPSILLSTLCANNTNSSSSQRGGSRTRSNSFSIGNKTSSPSPAGNPTMPEALWEESGIGLTCAKLCPPDGRRLAVGCDDSAIRIWDLMEKEYGGQVCQVLLGHQNGFPVFDLSWNRDGRNLLSAGGDGSIRLWDTMAHGPFGQVTKLSENDRATDKPTTTKVTSSQAKARQEAKEALETATKNLENAKAKPEMNVPGLRPESTPYRSGAALAVYRGHAPNTPVWSVSFAPCGYYFASAGADATARLWTTDRPTPVRLFTGHTSNSVHSVVFHPNCNYILTGSEDRTARLWDIQTGCCVRLLNGCSSGLYKVEIDPSGQYAAGADALGTVHLWDLGTGKKVTEFKPKTTTKEGGMIHSISFSACGTALATGGDDRVVRIWDVQKAAKLENKPVFDIPAKSFQTRRTVVMDLSYTKRNLLLSVGKYITAVPAATPIAD